jgi:hypothetical protein
MIEVFAHTSANFVNKLRVLRLLRVVTDGSEMVYSETARAHGLEFENEAEVIEKRARISAIEAEPERWLDACADSGLMHRLVVVRRAGVHVDVGLDDNHFYLPSISGNILPFLICANAAPVSAEKLLALLLDYQGVMPA